MLGKKVAMVIIGGFIIIFGLMTYPALNSYISGLDMSNQLPLTAAFVAGLPYMFLGLLGYWIYCKSKK